MTGSRTIAGAQDYWDRYYAEHFRFGLGTEDILATLMQVPPVGAWADLGCGSESMLWAIGLRAQRLVAVDSDFQRLAILRTFTSAARPRGVHRTALTLCGRGDPDDFPGRCRSLVSTVAVDCLTGHLPSNPNLPAAVTRLGATVFGELMVLFQPHGITCVLVLAESHFIVSTWPEHKLVHIDLFTCRADTDPEHALQPVMDALGCVKVHAQRIQRVTPTSFPVTGALP